MPPKIIFIGHSLGGLVIKQVGISPTMRWVNEALTLVLNILLVTGIT